MCGIAGALIPAGAGEPAMVAALEALRHRGPDAQTCWQEKGVYLGHTRLAILDLIGGEQPMHSPCGRYTIVFNGEIYNFAALREEMTTAGWAFRSRSDTEVLLALFVRLGFEKCLARLRGMFAFAVWDAGARELSLARDRLGVKPLVYAEIDGTFGFASEIYALRALLPHLPSEIDPVALDHYFSFLYIPSPLTGFRGIRKLPPAHAMVVGDGGIRRLWRYWQVDPARLSNLSYGEACEAVREKFLEATRLRMVADVPLGAFLSGGVDSAVTVAAMARLSDQPVLTFAVGFDDAGLDERPYARQAAEHLGTRHRETLAQADVATELPMLIRRCGEPFGDDSLLPTYLVSKAAREEVTVALTGDGGDEAFGGYRRHLQLARMLRLEAWGAMTLWRQLRKWTSDIEGLVRPDRRRPFPYTREDQALFHSPVQRHIDLATFFDVNEKATFYTPEFSRALAGSDAAGWFTQRFDLTAGAELINRVLLTDSYTYLPEDVLYKVDIASMAASLECRSPFLDHELVELAASLPPDMKIKGRTGKRIVREGFAHWLPPGFLERRKQGFSTPIGKWLRGDLAELVKERLLVEKRLQPWLDGVAVKELVEDHLSGKRPNARRLWNLLVAAEWMASIH